MTEIKEKSASQKPPTEGVKTWTFASPSTGVVRTWSIVKPKPYRNVQDPDALVHINTRVPARFKEEVKRFAAMHNMTLAQVMREGISFIMETKAKSDNK